MVSLAGPASNICLAFVAGILLRLVYVSEAAGLTASLMMILKSVTFINLFLAFFNMIPLPPLDGSGVLSAVLPAEYARKYESVRRYGPMLLIGIIALGYISGFSIIGLLAGLPAGLLYRLFTGRFYWGS